MDCIRCIISYEVAQFHERQEEETKKDRRNAEEIFTLQVQISLDDFIPR